MTLQNIVCSLESAKRLKELGMKQDSFYWWNPPFSRDADGKEHHHEGEPYNINNHLHLSEYKESYSAFTAEELLAEIPAFIEPSEADKQKENAGYLELGKSKDGEEYYCLYLYRHIIWNKSLAEACALMRIWLVENGYVRFEKK